jgi:hypothetical protein
MRGDSEQRHQSDGINFFNGLPAFLDNSALPATFRAERYAEIQLSAMGFAYADLRLA